MRSRNIKPGFFRNEDLISLPPLTRLLFAGLWCLADREGRLENRPRRIRFDILPGDECDVVSMLRDLERLGFILIYGEYIQIINFPKHQNPHHKENHSKIPPPIIQELIQKPWALPGQDLDNTGATPGEAQDKPKSSLSVARLIPDSLIPSNPPLSPQGAQESLALAIFLRDWIVRNNSGACVPQSTSDLAPWAKDIGLMITVDKRAPPKIKELIDWSQQDYFWRGVIDSPKKLRKNFDKLFIKSQSKEQSEQADELYVRRKKEGRCTACGTTLRIADGMKICDKCEPTATPVNILKLANFENRRHL